MPDLKKLQPYQPVLWMIAIIGLFGINGIFLYNFFANPELVTAAQTNPVSLIFILEAFLLMLLFAWFIKIGDFKRPGWFLFIIMSIVGSLAFSIPMFLILHINKS